MSFNFSAPAPAAGAPAPATGLFGTPAATAAPATGLFGAAPATTTAPASGGLFGAAPASTTAPAATTTPAPAGGLFGASAPKAEALAPSGGLFRAPTTGTAATTTTSAPTNQSLATIPAYHEIFPRLNLRHSVINHLDRAEGGSRELIHLLSVSGEEEAIGKSLADPTGILKRGVQEEGLRSALVKCCESSSAASSTTSGTSGGLFGGTSAFGGSLGQTNQQQQQQQQQVVITLHSKPTAITPSISKDVLLLSNELHLSIAESVALFAETNALILGNEGDGDTIMERKAIDDDFVESLICSGRIGFEEDGGEKVSASSSKATKKQEDVSAVVHMARHLFFHERAALLYTILDLIRHRIQAADETSATGNPIIVATDQLLQAGLVVNLINAIRELNDMSVR